MKNLKTKNKKVAEANALERQEEINEFLLDKYTNEEVYQELIQEALQNTTKE